MKIKILAILLLLSAGIVNKNHAQALTNKPSKKILVAYYSLTGNTKAVAEQIHKTIGGDIFEIVLEKPYSTDYKETVDRVKKEKAENYLPEIKDKVVDMKAYDVIFIGTPIWYGTVATPIFSFLKSYDFSGKIIIPFYTCGGGTEGTTVADMQKVCPDATFLPIFGVSKKEREDGTATTKIDEYLKQLKF